MSVLVKMMDNKFGQKKEAILSVEIRIKESVNQQPTSALKD